LTLELERRVASRTQELARSNEELHAQLGRLDLLSRITRAIAERQDLRSILQVVIRTLEESMPIDFGCVCLCDQPGVLTVSCVGVRSESSALALALTEQTHLNVDENGMARCMEGELIYEPDISGVQSPFPQRLARGGLRSLVATPFLVEDRVSGILVAARSAPDAFGSGDREFLRQLAEHVALAAHQAQLRDALQHAYDDLRRTQQAVMQQERLRALGQMASGIAHDINNAISPIGLYTESLLEKEPNLSERARRYLQTIQCAIEDVAATVARMRQFCRSHEDQIELAPVELNKLAQQVIDLTRPKWKDLAQIRGVEITLRAELAPELPTAMGVGNEIRDALTNLVLNAVDAMPKGGILTVRTRVGQSRAIASGQAPRRQAIVEVGDTGVGMPEDTRRRCIEPFFTTKGERGTGLGLAMVYGMVQRHNAEIEIDSTPGSGTTMRLIFPVPDSTGAGPVQSPAAPAVRRHLRILLVDDDPLLIKSMRDTLEGDGHQVVTADGGQAGIDLFLAAQRAGKPFEAVITDLGMPRVDGRQVASAVKTASRSTPVILLTGWGQRLMGDKDMPPQVDSLLGKPPRLHELREALARLSIAS
jgi:signal transduction histidine kinase/ActR/RegA family two-component response regulator